MDTTDAARRWAQEWERGWREHDLDRIAALYAPGVSYRSSPLRDLDDPRRFAEEAFEDEDSADVRFSEPMAVSGDRAAVEWWAVSRSGSGETTLAGISLLRFDENGLVCEERDYWHEETGGREPFDGWGR
jgi:hypothetical protein